MFLLTFILVLPQADPGPSKHFTEEQQAKALQATVRVANEKAEGTGIIIRQSGAWVYVLTAAHLTARAETVEVCLFSNKSEKTVKRARVVARGKETDVALLRFELREQTVTTIPLGPPDSDPKDNDFPALLTSCAEGTPTLVEEVVRKKSVRKPNATEAKQMWEVDGTPPKGRSGGPLIDRHGHVLGLGSGAGGDKGYYTHIDDIRDCLRENGFRWLLDEKEK
jgi:hypothetical protein